MVNSWASPVPNRLVLSWPDRLWWTLHQLLYLLALAAVTAVSTVVAARRRALEHLALQAGQHEAALAAVVESANDAIISKTLSTGSSPAATPAQPPARAAPDRGGQAAQPCATRPPVRWRPTRR
jgi:hypothetical protein